MSTSNSFTADVESRPAYQEICAEFYDLFRPSASEKEVEFYQQLLMNYPGKALEAMCGSGRIMIPLLQKGYQVQGVDYSQSMLKNCRRRCLALNLEPELFQQSLEDLSLEQEYNLIFIALGSFQHFAEREVALKVLKRLRQHLSPTGLLVIDIIMPWGLIKKNIKEGEDFLSAESSDESSIDTVLGEDGFAICCTRRCQVFPQEQLILSQSRYEKTFQERLVGQEEDVTYFRWYHRFEMELFLEKAGFSVTRIADEVFDPHLQSTVYLAAKSLGGIK